MFSRSELLDHLRLDTRVLQDARIAGAFADIDRGDFVPEEYVEEAYEDYALPIGHGQTISQPTTVAYILELLSVEEGDKVLDVGSGSGWSSALLSKLVGEEGDVYCVERVEDLLSLGQINVAKYGLENVAFFPAENVLGLAAHAPFDRILVSAAASSEVPNELVSQLKAPGRMVIPVGQSLIDVVKDDKGKVKTRAHAGFGFVPLVLE